MEITSALAAVAVTDLRPARDFYGRLLGREPDLEPMPSLAQWDLGGGSALQVVERPDAAGTSMATLVVDDVQAARAELGTRGIECAEVVDGAVSRLTQVTDPDGNTLTLVEPPRGA